MHRELLVHWNSKYHALIGTNASIYCARCAGQPNTLIFDEFERIQKEAILNISSGLAFRAVVHVCKETNCGGLGDRMRSAISAFLLAIATKRAFFMHHDKPIDSSIFFRALRKDISLYLPHHWKDVIHTTKSRSKNIPFFQPHNTIPINWLENDVESMLFSNNTGVLTIRNNDYYVPQLIKNPFTKLALQAIGADQEALMPYCLLNYIFHPTDIVLAELSRIGLPSNLSLSDPQRNSAYIAIHFRSGNNSVTKDPARVPIAAMKDFFTCATAMENRLLRKYLNLRHVDWLIASDDENVLKEADLLYGLRKLVAKRSGDIVHIDKFLPSSTNSHTGFLRVVTEHLLLAFADEIVMSPSGFSVYSYYRKHVIDSGTSEARMYPFRFPSDIYTTCTRLND